MNKIGRPREAVRWARQGPDPWEVRNMLLWAVQQERQAQQEQEYESATRWKNIQSRIVSHLTQLPDELVDWLIEAMEFSPQLIENGHFPHSRARQLMLDSASTIQQHEQLRTGQQQEYLGWSRAADNLVAWDHHRGQLPESVQEFAATACLRDSRLATTPHQHATDNVDLAFQVWVHLTSRLERLDSQWLYHLYQESRKHTPSRDQLSYHPSIDSSFLLTVAQNPDTTDRDFLEMASMRDSVITGAHELREKLQTLNRPRVHAQLIQTSNRSQELNQLFGELVKMEPSLAGHTLDELTSWQHRQLAREDIQQILAHGDGPARARALRETGDWESKNPETAE